MYNLKNHPVKSERFLRTSFFLLWQTCESPGAQTDGAQTDGAQTDGACEGDGGADTEGDVEDDDGGSVSETSAEKSEEEMMRAKYLKKRE